MSTLILGLTWCLMLSAPEPPTPRQRIAQVLDDFHDAAAKADERRYFGHLADEAVFLGTDATERWTKEAFRRYCKPYFDKGQGWLYVVKERHIHLAASGQTAWFDEMLENKKNGLCRGSGVLVKVGEDWRIAQYNLSIPIPNERFPEVKKIIDRPKSDR